MLGFLFGAALTLYVLNRHRRGGFRRGTYSRRRRRREWMLDRLSAHLDTSPSQDRAMGDTVDSLFEAFEEERGVFSQARKAVSDALKGAEYDATVLDRLKAEQDASLRRVHTAIDDALATAHEVLDDEQRERLASMLQSGARCRSPRRGRHLHAA
jgi:hypothetical protein